MNIKIFGPFLAKKLTQWLIMGKKQMLLVIQDCLDQIFSFCFQKTCIFRQKWQKKIKKISLSTFGQF